VRKFRLQVAIFADHGIIIGVGNFGIVAVVIGAVVARNLLRQPHQPVGRFCFGRHASIAAIFATLFMLRAVPCLTAGSLSLVLPMPSP